METVEKKVILLQEKFDNHINDFKKHQRRFDDHVKNDRENWAKVTESINENSRCINQLAESTRGLVETWQVADGTVKAFGAFGRIMKWLSSLAVLGVAVKWFIDTFGS